MSVSKLATLARMIAGIPLNAVYVLACLLPKDRKLWLFGAWQGRKYLDNPKFIYRFVLEQKSDIRAFWVVKDRTLYAELQKQRLPVLYAYSLRGIGCQLRAGIVVFTHAVEWEYVPWLIGRSVKRVQTWHGMPIKKIGYDDAKGGNARLKARLRAGLLPYLTDRCDLVIAGSEVDKAKYTSAFNVRPEDVRITGYPRNDEIVRCMQQQAGRETRRKQVIYMPTFRGKVGSQFTLLRDSGFDFARADQLMRELGAEFYIKLHPVQVFAPSDLEAIRQSAHVHALGNASDIYEQVGQYDLLITDFSGIYFDFLITGKPIIMAPLDLGGYTKNDRELYYSYEELCPDTPCHSWSEVFMRMADLLKEGASPGPRYENLRQRFHRYLDANSSARVTAELQRMVGLADGPLPAATARSIRRCVK